MVKNTSLDCWAGVAENSSNKVMTLKLELLASPLGKDLPSQLYEKQVFFYSPNNLALKDGRPIEAHEIQDFTPSTSLNTGDSIRKGGTFCRLREPNCR